MDWVYIYGNMQYIVAIMAIIDYIAVQRFPMGINIKLKLARVEKGLSQQDLADRVQATRQTIGLIEKADFNPSLGLCIRIAKALGKTLDQLFWEEEKHEKSRAANR
jgi:putative transcriptional regulator